MAWTDYLPFVGRKKESHGPNSPTFYSWVRNGGEINSVNPSTAMQITTVYSCVKVLAESISAMPIGLFRIDDKAETRTHQRTNKLNVVVSKSPNDFMTAFEFWQFMMINLCLRGNAYAIILRTENGRPFELLPLTFDMVTVEIKARNQLIYHVNFGKDGEDHFETLTARDVLHLKHLSVDGVMGTSPITYNATMLDTAKRSRDYQIKLLKNDATPRGVLHSDGVMGDEAYERLKTSWLEWQSGDNQASIALLEDGFKFDAVSLSPADLEILSQMKYSRSEIAGMYRVPLHMLGDLERSTNNNIEHQGIDFYTNTLRPWTRLIEQRLDFQLLDTNVQEFKFDNSELVQGTFEDRVNSYGKLITLGVYSPNDVRKKLGDNPRKDGDEYIVASNNLDFGSGDKKPDKGENSKE